MSEILTDFHLSFSPSAAGRIAVLTMDNGTRGAGVKPNNFGEHALASLASALDALEAETDVKGMLLTGMPFMFAAGADITSFTGVTEEFARLGGQSGHDTFQRISALPFPTLAAINGVALGGGLEIALHCDHRVISTGAMLVAFPEVFLGILPAWGGTQLATRLVGAADAVEAIVTNPMNNNRMMKPQQAFEKGFADRLIASASFHDDAFALLVDLVSGAQTIEREPPSNDDLDDVLAKARQFVDAKVHGATRAPYLALELIEHAARGGDLAEGRAKEVDALAELLPSRQAQASIYAFELTQTRAKKQPWKPDAPAKKIQKTAVIGAGLMGAQLGSLFLQRYEAPLVMKDINTDVLGTCRAHIEGDIDKLVQKKRIKPGKAHFLKSLVTYTVDYADVAGADVVIEAVLERMDLKKAIFADLEAVLDDDALLLTNTSSLSVSEMAADLQHPERVVGFHFFNPVAVLPLVEIIKAEQASPEALATAYAIAKKLKKTAVECADAPAFIVNRLLVTFNSTATQALRRGNSFTEIDTAIKDLGLPMGPFELFGLVGIQVAYHTAETLAEAFPDRLPIDPNFAAIAESGVTSIYDWSAGPGVVHDVITDNLTLDEGAEPMTADEIREMALEKTAREVKIMLEEGVVADARDIDTSMIMGAGFPFFMGGLCKYLDQVGISDRLFGAPLITATDGAFA